MKISRSARISCQAHDYVEIVCMRGSKVVLHLYTGEQIVGVAVDVMKLGVAECIKLQTPTALESIDLALIKTLVARGNPVESHNFSVQLGAD